VNGFSPSRFWRVIRNDALDPTVEITPGVASVRPYGDLPALNPVHNAEAIDPQHVGQGPLRLRSAAALSPGRAYRFNVRPEDIRLLDTLDQAENSFFATVDKCEFLGAFSLVTLTPVGQGSRPLLAQFSSNYLAGRPIHAGSTVRVGIPAEQLFPMPESV